MAGFMAILRPLICMSLLELVVLAEAKQLVRARNPSSAISTEMSPVRKVITLIQEMKVQVEKEAAEDQAAYDKYRCWCNTNQQEKTSAINSAEAKIEQLSNFIEEAAGRSGELKSQIAALASDIADDQDAIATATATRDEEKAAFLTEEADMKETKKLLEEALEVLSKVQLLQKEGKPLSREQEQLRTVLVQVKARVRTRGPVHFASVMQRDLFDVFGALDAATHDSGFLQASGRKLLPWEKTDEQKGKEAKPNELRGAAANAKSYNSRSGGILGLLNEMRDQFIADLASAQKEDLAAEVAFQNLRSAKEGEIQAGTASKNDKEASLADTLDKSAKAKEDRAATSSALEADQGFLASMTKDCKTEDEQYAARSKIRGEELVALAETLKILTADDARDLYAKTETFLQLGSTSSGASKRSVAEATAQQDAVADSAMRRIAAVAKKHKNWALVSLAVRVRLDAFTEVKKVMDKMLAELAKQQKEETEKREYCNTEIDQTEDEIKKASNLKEDLDQKHTALVNSLESLSKEIAELRKEEEEMKVSLKQAGEQRKEQNQIYQTSVMDQRATVNILKTAQKRLQMFYTPKAGLVQEPGQAVSAAPPKPKEYSKSAGSGGVLQLIAKIIENGEKAETELQVDEQNSQALYAELVQATTANIEAARKAIAEKEALSASARADKSETSESQTNNNQDLANLAKLLKGQHLECDWLLKYYDVRQQARSEEIDAINDAKAVLDGASFKA